MVCLLPANHLVLQAFWLCLLLLAQVLELPEQLPAQLPLVLLLLLLPLLLMLLLLLPQLNLVQPKPEQVLLQKP